MSSITLSELALPSPGAGLLITGARGFIGSALMPAAHARGWRIHATTRAADQVVGADQTFRMAHLDVAGDWSPALRDCQAVVHLAAQVHVMGAARHEQIDRYRAVNLDATLRLAEAAADSGVRRFVFLSSAKVLGEFSPPGQPFSDTSPAAPADPYAESKHAAEQALFELAARTDMEVVVLRPPLVYGSGAKANFHALMQALDRGMPLPLARLNNRRTLCYLGNLVDAILLALVHPAAASRGFLVADAETLSLSDFVRRMASSLGRPSRQWPLPPDLLGLVGRLLNRQESVRRLIESYEIDISGIQSVLGWKAPYSVAAAIEATAQAWRADHAA
jgi:nucleoside-diphosphate-sugar epimerase